MADVDVRTRREPEVESVAITRAAKPTSPRIAPRRRLRILPVLITLATAAVAVVLGRAMWDAYMGAPWTRDGMVRVYVVTMAPEVAGRIVELLVKDNQFVHKGDLLMVIDPIDYKIAVRLNEAAVQQAQANALNAERQASRRQKLTDLAVTTEEKQTYSSNAVAVQAQYQQAVAKLEQARGSTCNGQKFALRLTVGSPIYWRSSATTPMSALASSRSSMPTRFGLTAISRRPTLRRSMSAMRPPSS